MIRGSLISFSRSWTSSNKWRLLSQRKAAGTEPVAATPLASMQLDVISATTAEDREFNELRRDLPRATSLGDAATFSFAISSASCLPRVSRCIFRDQIRMKLESSPVPASLHRP